MTVMCLPENLRRSLRTSNRIERINKELKRRSNAIGVFPNVDSVLRLMGSLLIEINDTMISQRISAIPMYSLSDLKEDLNVRAQLKLIAEQQQMLAA
jgi:transposase-like protein